MKLNTNQNLYIPLTNKQLKQIITQPTYDTIINILENGLYNEKKHKKIEFKRKS